MLFFAAIKLKQLRMRIITLRGGGDTTGLSDLQQNREIAHVCWGGFDTVIV